MNDVPKVNEKRNEDKKFCKKQKKIAEQVRLLGYYYISQKFLSAGIGLGYARIATTPRQKTNYFLILVTMLKKPLIVK